ncbi:MAG TPA: T9SS type A sorting domain-containing protein [Chitinophagaceae bacterium]|nr:T9SS type A sorting domain-containing protein [Chitinophagaceae bacterium]HNF71470.1 T9SS type A sorting domain-containing protein [Chitinophagaceae bacterium]
MIDDITMLYGIPENFAAQPNRNRIQFYPNPLQGQILHLERKYGNSSQNEVLSLYQPDGRKIFQQQLQGEKQLQIPVPPGNYILRYENGREIVHEKIRID